MPKFKVFWRRKTLWKRSHEKNWRRFKRRLLKKAALWRSYPQNWSSRSKLAPMAASAKHVGWFAETMSPKRILNRPFQAVLMPQPFGCRFGQQPVINGLVQSSTSRLRSSTLMDQDDQEAVLILGPPALFTEKGYMAPDDFFVPQRAVYGLRRSPRLWGTCRDETMESFQIEAEDSRGGKRKFHLRALQSEPNLWRVLEIFDESQVLWGLVMTYVDDVFICSSHSILEAIKEKFQETWKTSTPEYVSEHPIRFLGMEVSKRKAEGGKREEWYVTQRSYIKDLIEKSEEKVKERKIPVTRDQAHIEAPASTPTLEEVRGAQKCVGEVLWLLTRSRPDLMYGVSRMGSNVLKNPVKVMELGDQIKGYLKRTQDEGFRYQVDFKDEIVLQAYSDASFSPEGSESHGSFLVLLEGSPIFWQAADRVWSHFQQLNQRWQKS